MNNLKTIAKLATLVVIGGGTIGAAVGITQAQSFHDAPLSADAANAEELYIAGNFIDPSTGLSQNWNDKEALRFEIIDNEFEIILPLKKNDEFKFIMKDNQGQQIWIKSNYQDEDMPNNIFSTSSNGDGDENWKVEKTGIYKIRFMTNFSGKDWQTITRGVTSVEEIETKTADTDTHLFYKGSWAFNKIHYYGGKVDTIWPGKDLSWNDTYKFNYFDIPAEHGATKVVLNWGDNSKTKEIVLDSRYQYQVISQNNSGELDDNSNLYLNYFMYLLNKERTNNPKTGICGQYSDSKLIPIYDSLYPQLKEFSYSIDDNFLDYKNSVAATIDFIRGRSKPKAAESNLADGYLDNNVIICTSVAVLATSLIAGFAFLLKKRKANA